jgi:hypothetical protein
MQAGPGINFSHQAIDLGYFSAGEGGFRKKGLKLTFGT